jgi:hypothetical protein
MRRLACLIVLLALAAMPALAGAQSLFGTPTVPTPTTATAPPATTSKAPSSGMSTLAEFGIFAFGIGAIAVIAVIILTDARRRAPVVAEDAVEEAPAHLHSREKKKRRAKGREARNQRKKNRPKH